MAALSSLYPWIKAAHVIAMVAWMAGLFYLPRLFVYHAERAAPGSELDATFRVMEDRLLRTIAQMDGTPFPSTAKLIGRVARGKARRVAGAELAYCAEVVAASYAAMGLLDSDRPTNYYDPGKFWSGDDLDLLLGARLGDEIRVLT